MLKIEHLSKKYGNKKALEDVSLEIPRGQIVGLFGENGAGKTTFMKCVLRLVRCKGNVTLDGVPINNSNIEKISFATSEHSFFSNLTPKEHCEFYAQQFTAWNEKRFWALMDFFELPAKKRLNDFSFGQKNQFEVILALSQGAEYILMDEPFAGNDVFNREDFYKVLIGILEPNETIVLSTHLIEEVAGFISRAVLLRGGIIVGDKQIEELEEEGIGLVGYIKQTYQYQADRVSRALRYLVEEE